MIKVSVLVAVYNGEAYLRDCLDSLLGQTVREIQVICIDDCSTDGSLALLRNYATKDSRIEVLSLTENQGQAHARNVGLTIAKGDYITFLDCDDWYAPDTLAQAIDVFERYPNTDTVLLDVMKCTGTPQSYKGEIYPMPTFEVLTGREAFNLSIDWTIHGVYISRKKLYERYPYDDSSHTYSDDNTTRLHYFISREVRHCKGVYFYRQNPQSVTHHISVRRFDYLRANESMKQQLELLHVDDIILEQYETVRWRVLIDLYMFYYTHGKELIKEERVYGLSEIHRVWENINRSLLDKHLICKFGYRPMAYWWMFRTQEWLYFTLRGWLGKNY